MGPRPTGIVHTTWWRARRCVIAGNKPGSTSCRRREPDRVHAALHGFPPRLAHDHRRYEQPGSPAPEHRSRKEGPAAAGDRRGNETTLGRHRRSAGSARVMTRAAVVLSQLGRRPTEQLVRMEADDCFKVHLMSKVTRNYFQFRHPWHDVLGEEAEAQLAALFDAAKHIVEMRARERFRRLSEAHERDTTALPTISCRCYCSEFLIEQTSVSKRSTPFGRLMLELHQLGRASQRGR